MNKVNYNYLESTLAAQGGTLLIMKPLLICV